MNILSALLAVTLMVSVLFASVIFHRRTVCRQRAHLMGVVSVTRHLLDLERSTEMLPLPDCGTTLYRHGQKVRGRETRLVLDLRGKL